MYRPYKYRKSFTDMIRQAFQWYSDPNQIDLVKEEVWERVDIFSNNWFADVFEVFVHKNYRDIDFFPDPNPQIRFSKEKEILAPDPYIILGGFYGWNENKLELLAIGVLNIAEAKLTAYDKDANPVPSSKEKV